MNQLGMVKQARQLDRSATREMETSKTIQKASKAIVRMAVIAGLEPLVPVAEAADACAVGIDHSGTIWWLWFMIVILVLMVVGLVVAGFKVWRMLEKDFSHCWNQVADSDDYEWQLKEQIDQFYTRTDNLDRQNEIYANEGSMALDYVTGVHFAVVELGGFVRHLHGLTEEQWNRLQVEERGNLVSCNVMGSARYLTLARQRVTYEAGNDTDERTVEPREEGDGEAMDADGIPDEEDDAEPTEVHQPAFDGRLMGLMDILKQQQELATRSYEVKQILMMQRTSLKILRFWTKQGWVVTVR